MLVESKYKVQYCGFRAFNRGTVIIVMLVSSWAYDGGVCVCVCVGGGGGGVYTVTGLLANTLV